MIKKRNFLFIVFFYVWLLPVTAQEYSYTRYDSKDGLAGSTVYCMAQDKEGFMWFGTETGLSRFDGTHFKNFKKEDGLPDNEVLQVFADSKGRVWISPFKKAVCYYFKGKIYNEDNDSRLKQLHITNIIVRYAEDDQGNILLQEWHRIHLISANGQVSTISKIGNDSIRNCVGIACNKRGGFWIVLANGNIYEFNNNRFVLWKKVPYMAGHFIHVGASRELMMWLRTNNNVSVLQFGSQKQFDFPVNKGFESHNVALLDDQHFAICLIDGVMIYEVEKCRSMGSFLPGVPVLNTYKDTESNWWFATRGKGIYRLNSAYVLNIKNKATNLQDLQVTCLTRFNNKILAGSSMRLIQTLDFRAGTPFGNYIALSRSGSPLSALRTYGNKVFVGTGDFLMRLSPQLTPDKKIERVVVKDLCVYNNKLLVATDKNVLVVDFESFKVTDTIWHDRATTLYSNNNTIYIGTITGLYCVLHDRRIQYLGKKIPALRNRITAICEDAGHRVWAATHGDGVTVFKDGKAIAHFTTENGLTSNTCRTMFLHKNELWVGTDKGLNRIDISKPDYPVKKYTTGDGLASDIINAIYVEEGNVFVGTPEGVTFFDKQKIFSSSRCDLRFTDISVGGQTYYHDSMPALIPHAENNIQFNYVGISYKSAGDIRYRYRLLGLDSNWKETRETFLSYPILPSGDYELQLQAINKFDVLSKIVTARFTIEELLWEKTWFKLLMALFFLALTGLVVWLVIQRIRRREQEKTAISKRIGELEQLARKAQMNPHFIFNSLNSIQQYVMDADIVGANKFISGFSRLIRQTLDFSSKQEISVAEELDYLTNYLELEKTRLENAFNWSVTVAEDLNTLEYFIPPMILQPFVENSVRHGLRYRKDQAGKVTISIKKENNLLVCILEDNGVGRKTALKFKSANKIEYQSKGMSLTGERIAMLNKDNEHKITMQIDDLEDEQQKPLGTRVTLSFPIG